MTYRYCILQVEDVNAEADLFDLWARKAQMDTVSVRTLAAAVAYLQTGTPDVIVLDLSLPDGKGLDTLKRMLEIVGGRIPITVRSGFDSPEIAEQAIKMGADQYLDKMRVQPPLLFDLIKHAIFRHSFRKDSSSG